MTPPLRRASLRLLVLFSLSAAPAIFAQQPKTEAKPATTTTVVDLLSAAVAPSGAQVLIPEKLVPHFKPGKALREAVDAPPALDLDDDRPGRPRD